MKATNKFWENFIIESGDTIPKEYLIEPVNHDSAKWTSQNGKIELIAELEDMHLANIYRMLFKSQAMTEAEVESIMYASPHGEIAQYYQMQAFSDANDQLAYIDDQLHHIAYEVHKRGLFINPFNKSEEISKEKQTPTFPCPVCDKPYFTKEQALCCADADIQKAQKKTRKLRKLIK